MPAHLGCCPTPPTPTPRPIVHTNANASLHHAREPALEVAKEAGAVVQADDVDGVEVTRGEGAEVVQGVRAVGEGNEDGGQEWNDENVGPPLLGSLIDEGGGRRLNAEECRTADVSQCHEGEHPGVVGAARSMGTRVFGTGCPSRR